MVVATPRPSGLSAAYHLARLGHKAVIYEAGPIAGGMMRFGIPAYRLPRHELDLEIKEEFALDGAKAVLSIMNDSLQKVLSNVPAFDPTVKPESLICDSWAEK